MLIGKSKFFLIKLKKIVFSNYCSKNYLFNKNCFVKKIVPKVNF